MSRMSNPVQAEDHTVDRPLRSRMSNPVQAEDHTVDRPLRIKRRDSANMAVLAVHGELDVASGPDLREALRQAIDERPRPRVVVDLDGVDFIDSAGLAIVVGALKRARDHDGDLVLVATGRNVLKVLELTGLTRALTIHASLQSALNGSRSHSSHRRVAGRRPPTRVHEP